MTNTHFDLYLKNGSRYGIDYPKGYKLLQRDFIKHCYDSIYDSGAIKKINRQCSTKMSIKLWRNTDMLDLTDDDLAKMLSMMTVYNQEGLVKSLRMLHEGVEVIMEYFTKHPDQIPVHLVGAMDRLVVDKLNITIPEYDGLFEIAGEEVDHE